MDTRFAMSLAKNLSSQQGTITLRTLNMFFLEHTEMHIDIK